MQELTLYQVDAFTDHVFGGNPAAICPLDEWLPDATMQAIAQENNLAETAFFCGEGNGYRLRWFTPEIEVKLCGHATLAAAHVLFEHLGYPNKHISFETQSGTLTVQRKLNSYSIDFPAFVPQPYAAPSLLDEAMGISPQAVFKASEYLTLVYKTEEEIRSINPNMRLLMQISDILGFIITSPGKEVDVVSRFFAPIAGVPEDPVTGSAHCHLTPYWAQRLHKNELTAMQLSKRIGRLTCVYHGDRVELIGDAVTYLKGNVLRY